jgi:hypothetical protein
MGFSKEVKETLLVLCARHCCVCHRAKGVKVEIHHIVPVAEGGEDTLENAILLCFDCHADAGHYNINHPKGTKFSRSELQKQKDAWIETVRTHGIEALPQTNVELIVTSPSSILRPQFTKTTTFYESRNSLKDTFALIGKDIMEYIEEQKAEWKTRGFDTKIEKVVTYDDYINYLNGDNWNVKEDPHKNTCQPLIHTMSFLHMRKMKWLYLANCSLEFVFVNNGPEVIEDFKVYLKFDNVTDVDSVNKNDSYLDMHKYHYNVFRESDHRLVFDPETRILVQKDRIRLDPICFRPLHDKKRVIVKWEMLARGMQVRGEIIIPIRPVIKKGILSKYVIDPENHRPETEIESATDFEYE